MRSAARGRQPLFRTTSSGLGAPTSDVWPCQQLDQVPARVENVESAATVFMTNLVVGALRIAPVFGSRLDQRRVGTIEMLVVDEKCKVQ